MALDTEGTEELHTEIAILRKKGAGHVEVLYNEGARCTAHAVAHVQAKRRELMGTGPYTVLTMIPEGVEYDLETMSHDQGAPDRAAGNIRALAVVAQQGILATLTRLYLSYYPKLDNVLITQDEQAARAWLAERAEVLP